MNEVEIDELISAVAISNLVSSDKLSQRSYKFLLKGKLRTWSVRLDVPRAFPFCLPKAYLLDTELIGSLPHVNQRGVICLEESDSILCDHHRGQDILENFLKDLVKLLDRFSLAIYQDELLDELEGYYTTVDNVSSFYEPGNMVEQVYLKIYRSRKQLTPKRLWPLAILGSGVSTTFSDVEHLNKYQTIKILYLPLERALAPPKGGVSMDIYYVESLIACLSNANKEILAKLLESSTQYYAFFILLSMPRSTGENTQLLIKLTAKKSAPHPLKEFGNEWDVSVFGGVRSTNDYLAKRGGAHNGLADRRVGIIGCGSVGGIIADALGKAGVGSLVLVDPDLLLPENIHRHILGGKSITYLPTEKSTTVSYWPKTHAMYNHLVSELPKIKVEPVFKEFSESVARNYLSGCDLIISAVGSPSTNLAINVALKSIGHQFVIYCWNEAAGCGGHSTVHNLDDTCLECLHTDPQGNFVSNNLSLIIPGQIISKNLTGCGGVFTPFSYLDSMKTAQIAASQAVKVLLNGDVNFAESWKGEATQTLSFTQRYEEMSMMERLNIQKSVNCGVCSE